MPRSKKLPPKISHPSIDRDPVQFTELLAPGFNPATGEIEHPGGHYHPGIGDSSRTIPAIHSPEPHTLGLIEGDARSNGFSINEQLNARRAKELSFPPKQVQDTQHSRRSPYQSIRPPHNIHSPAPHEVGQVEGDAPHVEGYSPEIGSLNDHLNRVRAAAKKDGQQR